MITSNFKSKVVLLIRENINKFSYVVNGETKLKEPESVEVYNNKLRVNLMLDNTDIGKIKDIKIHKQNLDIIDYITAENTVYNIAKSTGNHKKAAPIIKLIFYYT